MFPFGSAHSPSGRPRGRIAANIHWACRRRTRTPPAENSRLTRGVVHGRKHRCRCPTVVTCAAGEVVAKLRWHSDSESASDRHERCRTRWRRAVHIEFRRFCMDLQPLGDRLIVELLDEEETTVGGIVLPDTAKEKPQRGTVLAVGPGRYEDGKLVPLDVATGDEIIYSKYGGTEVKVGIDEYLILRESDVLAKVDKAAKKTKVKA